MRSSGKGQARMGKGWPLRQKVLKLKPLHRAYTKVQHVPRLELSVVRTVPHHYHTAPILQPRYTRYCVLSVDSVQMVCR